MALLGQEIAVLQRSSAQHATAIAELRAERLAVREDLEGLDDAARANAAEHAEFRRTLKELDGWTGRVSTLVTELSAQVDRLGVRVGHSVELAEGIAASLKLLTDMTSRTMDAVNALSFGNGRTPP